MNPSVRPLANPLSSRWRQILIAAILAFWAGPATAVTVAPQTRAEIQLSGGKPVTDILVSGRFTFVATEKARGNGPEVYIFDSSPPSQPVLLASIHVGFRVRKLAAAGSTFASLAAPSKAA